MDKTIEAILNKLEILSKDVPGMSVYIISKKDNIELFRNYGYANIEKNIPVTNKSKWLIQSITKNVYATVAAWIVGKGEASFEDNIRQELKHKGVSFVSEKANRTNTARNGLSHTTGLFTSAGEEASFLFQPLKSIYKVVKYEPLFPNDEYHYTNLGYTLGFDTISTSAGYANTSIPAYEFAKLIDMNIFIYPEGERINLQNKAVSPYLKVNDEWEEQQLPLQLVFLPADAIVCTVKSLSKFIKFHLDKDQTLIPNNILNEIYQPISQTRSGENSWYGLGTTIYYYLVREVSNAVYGHAGGYSEGLSHQMLYDPEKEIGVVVLTNTFSLVSRQAAYYAYFALATDLRRAEEEFIKSTANITAVNDNFQFVGTILGISFPVVPSNKLIGRYFNQSTGYLTIYESDNKYYIRIGKTSPAELEVTVSIHAYVQLSIGETLVIILPTVYKSEVVGIEAAISNEPINYIRIR